jgi:hypothetical protein
MHSIGDSEEYFNRMSRSTSIHIIIDNRGVSCDIFLYTLDIELAKNANDILVENMNENYLHFNSNLTTNICGILLDDENPLARHFEPLL